MPQFYTSSRNPAYAQGAANLSEALFGKPMDVGEELRNKYTATKTAIAGNELYGQNQYRDILEGVNGDLNSVDGGRLAAAVGLANINPRAFTSLSLDPRFGEMEQRRATVASGGAPSMGSLAADIGLTAARTRAADAQATKALRTGSGSYKPPALIPKNVEAIREAALNELGLDSSTLQNTIQQNQSLGTAILDMISNANTEGMGNAAYTQGRLQDFLSSVIDAENISGDWNPFVSNTYGVKQDALSSILNGGGGAPAITGQDPLPKVEAPQVQAERLIGGKRYVKINGQWFEE